MCLRFSAWTEVKWASRWCNALIDEGLHGFGLAESAKTMDSWSSWSLKGASIFLRCVFYFLVLFVVCRWWALLCSLHGMGGTLHWSNWSFVLPLDEMRNGGQWMASTRQSFQFDEAKFSASKVILGCRRKKAITSMCVWLRSRFWNKAVCHLLSWGMNALAAV